MDCHAYARNDDKFLPRSLCALYGDDDIKRKACRSMTTMWLFPKGHSVNPLCAIAERHKIEKRHKGFAKGVL